MNYLKIYKQVTSGTQVLLGTLHPNHADVLIPEKCFTTEGFEYHIYHPSGRALRTVLLVYGMCILGEEDGHVTAFARSCANAGLRVVVPVLPGLKQFTVDGEDFFRLEKIVHVIMENEAETIGMVGLSTGGNYALLLASLQAFCQKINPVLLLSPIYDLQDVFHNMHSPNVPEKPFGSGWNIYCWQQFVIAYRNHLMLEISGNNHKRLEGILDDYELLSLKEKTSFFEKNIVPLKLPGRPYLLNEGTLLDTLSAAGNLKNIRSSIYIIHGSIDPLVSPEHSRKIYAELSLRGDGFKQELLVTPWFSHVDFKATMNVKELFTIVSFLGELFNHISR